jgi:pSer/pThr/pTyr-binding forkhead associated (FHA) protein
MTGVTLVATGHFELRCTDDDRVVARFAAPGVEGYILGRSDASSTYVPDIDLAEFGALEHGISRRHVALVRLRDSIHVVDLDSANGTFLDGRRLQPEKAYPLQTETTLRLGTLNLTLIKMS